MKDFLITEVPQGLLEAAEMVPDNDSIDNLFNHNEKKKDQLFYTEVNQTDIQHKIYQLKQKAAKQKLENSNWH